MPLVPALSIKTVPAYRIYILDKEGHIAAPSIDVDCENDDEALAAARKHLIQQPVEVWLGARRIGRLDPRE